MISCFFFKQKTAYEMRISDWSSDVCSSDLLLRQRLIFRVLMLVAIADDHHIGGAVVVEDIVENLDIAVRHHQHAGARRHARDDIALRREIGRAVVVHDIFEEADIMPALHRRARQVEHEDAAGRSEEHTSELQSLMRTSYAVFCLKKNNHHSTHTSYSP